MSTQRVSKAVIPAAGLGTRFLPATKAIPKEMLPIVDRPAIQYVVEEAVRAGITDVLFITGSGKSAMEDHFDRRTDLEASLRAKGKDALLAEVEHASSLAQIHSVRQGEPLGLGHAVLQARGHIGTDSFVTLLGDDFVGLDDTLIERMMEVHLANDRRAVVAVMEVPADQVHLYGVISGTATSEADVFDVQSLVEKPPAEEAPSNLAIIGRYVLPGEIFDVLERTPRGAGDEIQLTDALNLMAQDAPILAVRHDGERYDTGDKLGFLKATVQLAAAREGLGDRFTDWLRDWLDGSAS